MLAQKLRSSTEISEMSETQSLQTVKSMLQVSLQEIAWSRSFLPKSMFFEKKMAGFADVKIHQLHSSDTKGAKMFESRMQNISDLLKTNRLSSVIFGVHDDADKPDDFCEMFHFHIEDTRNFSNIQTIATCRGLSSTKVCWSSSKEDVRSSATSMIRSLETLLGTLPAPSSTQKFMSIKLIARDGNLSSQDFSAESGFSCGMHITIYLSLLCRGFFVLVLDGIILIKMSRMFMPKSCAHVKFRNKLRKLDCSTRIFWRFFVRSWRLCIFSPNGLSQHERTFRRFDRTHIQKLDHNVECYYCSKESFTFRSV